MNSLNTLGVFQNNEKSFICVIIEIFIYWLIPQTEILNGIFQKFSKHILSILMEKLLCFSTLMEGV